MNSIAISAIVLACVFGGAWFGMFLPTRLPEDHLSPKSTDLVKMGTVDRNDGRDGPWFDVRFC